MSEPSDKELLTAYMLGFEDELWGIKYYPITNKLLDRAYSLGRSAALIGDDVSSHDDHTDEEILKEIKTKENEKPKN